MAVTGKNPDAICYDDFSKRVFTFNGRGLNSTVIDVQTDKVIGTIELGGKPEFAVTDGKGKLFVNLEDLSMIYCLNTITMKVENKWKLVDGKEPTGLAIDRQNKRLFSVCDNKSMVVMDCETGKTITTLPIGEGADGCAFDKETKRICSSNGDGTLTIVQEENANSFKVIENVKTMEGARTMALNNKTHHVYLPAAQRGEKPKATSDNPHPHSDIKPNTFVVLDTEPTK